MLKAVGFKAISELELGDLFTKLEGELTVVVGRDTEFIKLLINASYSYFIPADSREIVTHYGNLFTTITTGSIDDVYTVPVEVVKSERIYVVQAMSGLERYIKYVGSDREFAISRRPSHYEGLALEVSVWENGIAIDGAFIDDEDTIVSL